MEYFQIAPQLDRLPESAAVGGSKRKTMLASQGNTSSPIGRSFLPASPPIRTEKPKMQLAQAGRAESGLVLDYQTMGSSSNFTFQAGLTYYASGSSQFKRNHHNSRRNGREAEQLHHHLSGSD